MSDKPIAALRDASWCNSPGRAVVYHVCREDTPHLPKCGRYMILADDYGCYAEDVAPHERCQRKGCKEAWPEYKRKPAEL